MAHEWASPLEPRPQWAVTGGHQWCTSMTIAVLHAADCTAVPASACGCLPSQHGAISQASQVSQVSFVV